MLDVNGMMLHLDRALDLADDATGTIVGIYDMNPEAGTATLTHFTSDAKRRFRITIEEVAPEPDETDKAIDALIADICDRRGLKWEWEKIDDDVVQEIRAAWRDILTQHQA